MKQTLTWALWLAGWLLVGELGHRHWPGGGLLPLALWALCLAALRPQGCGLPTLRTWRSLHDWPLAAAQLVMLPMMAALPALADWCSADGWPPLAVTGAHLAAMLLPLACARQLTDGQRRSAVVLLLAAGGAALLLQDGLRGLMSAGLLHGAAWGLAAGAAAGTAQRRPAWRDALVAAALLLVLGAAIDQAGPLALVAVHGALALVGLTVLIGAGSARRHNRPHAPAHHSQP